MTNPVLPAEPTNAEPKAKAEREAEQAVGVRRPGPTPRTDALATILVGSRGYGRLWDHARELERELAKAHATIRRQQRYAQAVADAVDADSNR